MLYFCSQKYNRVGKEVVTALNVKQQCLIPSGAFTSSAANSPHMTGFREASISWAGEWHTALIAALQFAASGISDWYLLQLHASVNNMISPLRTMPKMIAIMK